MIDWSLQFVVSFECFESFFPDLTCQICVMDFRDCPELAQWACESDGSDLTGDVWKSGFDQRWFIKLVQFNKEPVKLCMYVLCLLFLDVLTRLQ